MQGTAVHLREGGGPLGIGSHLQLLPGVTSHVFTISLSLPLGHLVLSLAQVGCKHFLKAPEVLQ